MDPFAELERLVPPAGLLGYLNFSQGKPDPRWQRQLNEAYRFFAEHGRGPETSPSAEPWKDLHVWLANRLEQLRASGATVHRRQLRQLDRLTPGELPLARLAAQGFGDREIAALLLLGPQTVRAQLAGLLAKLGITTRAELSTVDLDDSPDRPLTP